MFVKSAVVMNTGTVAAAQPAENSQNVAGTNPVDPKISEVAKNVIPNTKTEADNKAIPKKGCWKCIVDFLEKIFCCLCRVFKNKDSKNVDPAKSKDNSEKNANAADQAATQKPDQNTIVTTEASNTENDGKEVKSDEQPVEKQEQPVETNTKNSEESSETGKAPARPLPKIPEQKTNQTEIITEPPSPPVVPSFNGEVLKAPPPPPPLTSNKTVTLRTAARSMDDRLEEQRIKAEADEQERARIQKELDDEVEAKREVSVAAMEPKKLVALRAQVAALPDGEKKIHLQKALEEYDAKQAKKS